MIQLGEEIHPPISTPVEWLGTSCDLFEFSMHIYKMKKLNSVFCIPGAFLVAQMVKNLLQCRRPRFDPWVGKIWRSEWLPTPIFLPGEFHGQRSLEGYSPWGFRESDMTE